MVIKIIKILKNNVKILEEIFQSSNKNKIQILREIFKYERKYQINLEDYLSFQFYNLEEQEVATFFTYQMNNKLVDQSNKKNKKYIFNNKELFDIIFNDYLGRGWVSTESVSYEEFVKFVGNKTLLFYKKLAGRRGIGAKKIDVLSYNGDLQKLYNDIKKLEKGILEEHIIAHKEINKICDTGLSTIRVVTLNQNGKCKILTSVFMISNGGIVNCEVTGGGLSACINVDTGVVETDAVDLKRNFYEHHPISGQKIRDFQVPYWEEVIELVNKVYNKVPGINYVGWDIAITDNGPIIIEGNASWPSHRIWQVPYLREKKGKKEEMIKKLTEN